MRAVIYTRVSTQEQVSNQSLGVQERACREYCERHQLEILRLFVEEGESAKTADRTQLRALLAYCRQTKPDVVVIYALDRLARSLEDHVTIRRTLRQSGVQLRAVNAPIGETPEAKFLESVLAAAAQLDNDMRAVKTKDGMRAAAEQGRWVWQAPVGYLMASGDQGKNLIPDPRRAPLVLQAFELLASGLHGRNDVLEKVTAMGLVTRRGAPLTPQSFAALTSNPVYCGRLVAPSWGLDQPGTWPAIVEPGLWIRAQAVMCGRSPSAAPHRRRNPDFPLRAFVRCEACGRPVTGSFARSHTGRRYPYYHCTGRCHAVRVRREKLEGQFVDLLDSLRPSPPVLDLFRSVVVDVWGQGLRQRRERTGLLEAQLADLRRKRERLDEVYIYQGGLEREVYEEQRRRLGEQQRTAEMELRAAQGDRFDPRPVVDFAVRLLTQSSRMWGRAGLDQRQQLQKTLFPCGIAYAGGFRTPVSGSIFYELEAKIGEKSSLVSPTGLEPVLPP